MTFRFCDGFDSYASASELINKWSTVTSAAFSATAGRFGGGALSHSAAPRDMYVTKGVAVPSGAKIRVGFHIKYSASAVFAGPGTTYYLVGFNGLSILRLSSNGAPFISVYGNTSSLLTSAISLFDNEWHWVEFEVLFNSAASTAQLWVDGISQGTFSGTIATARAISSVTVSFDWVTGGTQYLDDVVVWDDQGSTFNAAPLGPQRISTLVPNADGDLAQFTPKTGTDHYAMVNGGYASTNYVSDSGTGNTDLYRFPALSYAPTAITAVVGNYFGQNTGAGTTNLIPKIKTSGSVASNPTMTLSVGTNSLLQSAFSTDAASAAWTAASVNAMQLGMGN